MMRLLTAALTLLLFLGLECSDFEIADPDMKRVFHEATLKLFKLEVKYPRDVLAIKTAKQYQRKVANQFVEAGIKNASRKVKYKKQYEEMKKEKYEDIFTLMHELRQAGLYYRGLKPGDDGFEGAQTAVIHLYVKLETAEVLFEIFKRNLRLIEISGKGGILAQGWAALKSEIGIFFGFIYFFFACSLWSSSCYRAQR